MTNGTSREAFEAQCLYLGGSINRNGESTEFYTSATTAFAWAMWQASRKHALLDAEDAVVTLHETNEPPYLIDICNTIKGLK